MLTIHVYGIDHSRAPLGVREDLAFSDSEIGELAPLLVSGDGGAVKEVMILSTCNRTEVYLVLDGTPEQYPLEPLRRYRPQASALDNRCLRYHLPGQKAVLHMYQVAASLQSEVVGDTQIAGQLHRAAAVARKAGTLGPILSRAVDGAMRSAKRVRRETGLSAGGAGTGAAVLQNLRRHRGPRSRGGGPVKILLLGAGRLAEEVAAHLIRSGGGGSRPPVPDVEIAGIWSRDSQKAARLAARIGSRPLPAEAVERALTRVDAVVTACRGRLALLSEPVLGPAVAGRCGPLLVIDLGVPRNLDPEMADRDGIQAVFLDQLHQQIRERSRIRREAIEQARQIAASEAEQFEHWQREWPLRPLRSEMYASIESVLTHWRSRQPDAIRQLRVALHRSLEQAFGSVGAVVETGPPINQ